MRHFSRCCLLTRLLGLAAAALLVGYVESSAALGETTAAEVEEDNSLATSLVTLHKTWGRGYVGGSVRALFFVHGGPYGGDWCDPGTRLREVVELAQRFDLQADAILFGGPTPAGNWEFHGQKLGEKRAERLLAQPYSLYVIAGFPMDKLPARLQYLIIEQVAKGAGLVCCGPGAQEFMAAKRRIAALPPALADAVPVLEGRRVQDFAAAYRMGKGRGVWLNYNAHALTPYLEFTWRRLAEYDYQMLVVGRAALWAARARADSRSQCPKVSRAASTKPIRRPPPASRCSAGHPSRGRFKCPWNCVGPATGGSTTWELVRRRQHRTSPSRCP